MSITTASVLGVLDVRVARPCRFALDSCYEFIKILARPAAGLLHHFGVTANQVTGVRLFIALILNLPDYEAWWFPWWFGGWYAVAMYSDAVDGVMAREFEHKPKNSGGGLFESLVDKVLIISGYWYPSTNFPKIFFLTFWGEILQATLALGYLLYAALAGIEEAIANTSSNIAGKTKMFLEGATCGLMVVYLSTPSQALDSMVVVFGALALVFLGFSILGKIKTMLG